jgi:thymidylate synthase (FAD)
VPPTASIRVQVVGRTEFTPPADVPWTTDADGGQAMVEFAGRAVYEAWDKPNPATASNRGYVQHVLQVGHLALLEHSTVTLYVTGVSRAVAAELVRHRHLSASQLSPRHLPDRPAVVEPAAIAADPELHDRFHAASEAALAAYGSLLDGLEERFADAPNAPLRRRQARQAARAVLPNALETRLVVTGNYRAWRHFVGARGSDSADAEIRSVALACLHELRGVAPHVFEDFRVSTLADGTEVAASPLVGEG